MRICIYGAGALGGELAARLLNAQVGEVSVVARGAHLQAIRDQGMRLKTSIGPELLVQPHAATDDPSTLPPQDLLLVALKAPSLPAQAAAIERLLAPDGVAVFVLNGIPWWWHQGLAGSRQVGTPHLPLLDPAGDLWRLLRERSLGCVAYSACEVVAPGVIKHSGLNHWLIGEPGGGQTERLRRTVDALARAGFKAEAPADIRQAVWLKLLRNASINPAGALTHLTVNEMRGDPELRPVLMSVVRDTMAVARACGYPLDDAANPEAMTAADPLREGIRPSMLQDVLAGRAIEVEALLGQPQVFARALGIATPTLDVVLALLRGRNRALAQGH